MFSDLKKGFQVHTLDTNTVPKYELGKVVAVSEPRYLPPQPGQYQAMQTRVVDLTVELTGETKTYTVPESQNVAKAMGITLSTSIDPIMNELNAIKNTSQDITEIKDIFEKCGAKKPDKATWGDVQYVFAMYYSDGFPKVFKCENELVKATLMYLDDPDAPEGVAFIRWLAVQDYLGEKINWKDLT